MVVVNLIASNIHTNVRSLAAHSSWSSSITGTGGGINKCGLLRPYCWPLGRFLRPGEAAEGAVLLLVVLMIAMLLLLMTVALILAIMVVTLLAVLLVQLVVEPLLSVLLSIVKLLTVAMLLIIFSVVLSIALILKPV